MKQRKVAVIVGSLSKNSLNRKLAKAFIAAAPEHLSFEIVEIGNLPMYNQDLDENPPKEWVEFRNKIRDMDALFFFTPEYNRSTTAVLKNALDIGSRPYGQNVWNGKPGAVSSGSISGMGGFGANHHLRQTLVFLNVPTMQQPEIYMSNLGEMFDNNGNIISDRTKEHVKGIMRAYAQWVEKILG